MNDESPSHHELFRLRLLWTVQLSAAQMFEYCNRSLIENRILKSYQQCFQLNLREKTLYASFFLHRPAEIIYPASKTNLILHLHQTGDENFVWNLQLTATGSGRVGHILFDNSIGEARNLFWQITKISDFPTSLAFSAQILIMKFKVTKVTISNVITGKLLSGKYREWFRQS